MSWTRLSLRYKIMAALTALPLAGLSLFLLLAVGVFEKDKIAYVYDTSLNASQTRAARVSAEIQSDATLAQSIAASYRADSKTLDETGREIFKAQGKILAFQIYAWDAAASAYARSVELVKDGATGLPATDADAKSPLASVKTKSIYIAKSPSPSSWMLAARLGAADDPKRAAVLALFDASEIADAFSASGIYESYLLQGNGDLVFGDASVGGEDSWGPGDLWSKLLASRAAPEGTAETASPRGRAFLASFVKVGSSELSVLSVADKRSALRAIDHLLRVSILFFIAVASVTVLLSVFAARGLTSALSGLAIATQRIAGGDFETRVDAKGGDEIGRLGRSFNVMAEEILRLMKETAEKARMETELATAKTVQETLFPPNLARLGAVDVCGHYQPASECGGDWWHYCENGDFVYLWIGDATGHGAPAALLTSAARAVASVIEMGEPRSPSECVAILNRAIWDASKGRMMMTFFLAAIDKRTGAMYYANASHEAPLLLRASDQAPSRDDYLPLNDVNNPRLGENPAFAFQEAQIQLQPGDRIVFYTDGVTDVKSPEAKAWGERRFLKTLSACLHGEPDAEKSVGAIVKELYDFRKNTPLDDDVTLFLVSYNGVEAGRGDGEPSGDADADAA